MICNPDGSKKKEKMKDMAKKEGVYVGESARSIFERAGEHQADAISRKEDSHILKHWLSSHPEESEPPNFRIEVVGSFQDALTRQVAEAVRIELRGENVLNSRSEYTRCRIPRLVIDQDEWKKHKLNEKSELEKKTEPEEIVTLENGEEVVEVREEEKILSNQEKKSKFQKRKVDESNDKPAKKRRKFDLMANWGDEDEELNTNNTEVEQSRITAWLRNENEIVDDVEEDPEVEVGIKPHENLILKKTKLRQLELNFVKDFSQNWLEEAPEDNTIPEGRKVESPEPIAKKRKKNLKVLAKSNMKITSWLGKGTPDKPEQNKNDEDNEMEWQDDDERRRLENEIRTQERIEAMNMIRDIVINVIEDTPGRSETIKEDRILLKRQRALDRQMIGGLVRSMAESIPGQSDASGVLENVLEKVMVRVNMNMVWSVLESNRDIQEWVKWRIRQQRLEEENAIRMKAERLRKAKSLRNDLTTMDWAENEYEEPEMEWEDVEEHNALEKLMYELDINIEEMEVDSNEESDGFEEEFEHKFLDKILQELEYAEKAWSTGLELEENNTAIDECIQTVSCAGNCTGNCEDSVSNVVPPSAIDQGRGKNVEDNIQLSPEVSECIRSIHCTGDCTCVQQGAPLAISGETGYIVMNNNNEEQSSGQNITSTINPEYLSQFPSFMDWMSQFQRVGAGDDVHQQQEDGHQGGEGRALGGEVMGGEGGGEGRVSLLVKFHENSSTSQKKSSRMSTPKGRRGVRRDSLIQTRLSSFANFFFWGGARKLPGLLSGGGGGKRKLNTQDSDSPGKLRRLEH